ncbi:MAG: D-glucuronyl C5-epimerase family protein [Candidatus Hodarchaeota archaeon]
MISLAIFALALLFITTMLLRDVLKFFRSGFGENIRIDFSDDFSGRKYYIHSEQLFQQSLEYDKNGAVMSRYKNDLFYNPAYTAWHGLVCLNKYYSTDDTSYLNTLEKQIAWLKQNAKHDRMLGNVWYYNFDWKEGDITLKKPWISAMAQGLIISLLVKTYMLTKEQKLLQLAEGATKVYQLSTENGGIKYVGNSSTFYEEYPSEKALKILDGFIFSLLGVYDLFKATGNEKYLHIFNDGVTTIERNINFWDYRQRWSRYGSHKFLCTPLYNKLNSKLLFVLYTISKRKKLLYYSRAWQPDQLSIQSKVEILLAFFVTRNIKRLRYFWSYYFGGRR